MVLNIIQIIINIIIKYLPRKKILKNSSAYFLTLNTLKNLVNSVINQEFENSAFSTSSVNSNYRLFDIASFA